MGRIGMVIRRMWGDGMRWRIEKMKWMIYIYMHGYENVIVLVSGSFWRSNPIKIKSRNLLMEDSDFLFFFGTD